MNSLDLINEQIELVKLTDNSKLLDNLANDKNVYGLKFYC